MQLAHESTWLESVLARNHDGFVSLKAGINQNLTFADLPNSDRTHLRHSISPDHPDESIDDDV